MITIFDQSSSHGGVCPFHDEHFRPSERRALLEAAVEIIKVTRVERPRDASISADEAHDEGYSN